MQIKCKLIEFISGKCHSYKNYQLVHGRHWITYDSYFMGIKLKYYFHYPFFFMFVIFLNLTCMAKIHCDPFPQCLFHCTEAIYRGCTIWSSSGIFFGCLPLHMTLCLCPDWWKCQQLYKPTSDWMNIGRNWNADNLNCCSPHSWIFNLSESGCDLVSNCCNQARLQWHTRWLSPIHSIWTLAR